VTPAKLPEPGGQEFGAAGLPAVDFPRRIAPDMAVIVVEGEQLKPDERARCAIPVPVGLVVLGKRRAAPGKTERDDEDSQ